MAAIVRLPPRLSSCGGVERGADGRGDAEGEGVARRVRASGRPCASRRNLLVASSSSSTSARRLASGGRTGFFHGDRAVLFVIQKLARACNGNTQRNYTVWSSAEKSSDNAASQVRSYLGLIPILRVCSAPESGSHIGKELFPQFRCRIPRKNPEKLHKQNDAMVEIDRNCVSLFATIRHLKIALGR